MLRVPAIPHHQARCTTAAAAAALSEISVSSFLALVPWHGRALEMHESGVSVSPPPSSQSLSGISRPPSLPGQRPVALSCTPETPCFLGLHAAVGGPPRRRRQHGRGAGLGVAWKPWNVGGEAALRPILVLLDPRASPALPVGGTVHTGWVVSSVLTQSSSTCVPRT
jgi:hypothetical protein